MAKPGSAADPTYIANTPPASEASNGALSAAAAAAGTVVADTGQLTTAGTYALEALLAVLGVATAGVGLVIEHRNAANDGTVSVLGGCPAGGSVAPYFSRITIAANERIRVVVGAVALPASVQAAAHLRAYRVA